MQHDLSSNNTYSMKEMQLFKMSLSFTHLIVQREFQRTSLMQQTLTKYILILINSKVQCIYTQEDSLHISHNIIVLKCSSFLSSFTMAS